MIRAPRLEVVLLTFLSLLLTMTTLRAEESPRLELDRVVPGASGADLRAAFGDPVGSGRESGEGLRREEFSSPEAGYARVTVWYDSEERLTCARIIPVNALKLLAATLLFDLRGGPSRSPGHVFAGSEIGRFLHYDREGVHFFLDEGRVREIWRMPPGADLKAASEGLDAVYPPRALPERAVPVREGDRELVDFGDPLVDEEESSTGAPPRALSVGPPTVSLVLDSQSRPQLVITAEVFADGLKGEEIEFGGWLCSYPESLKGSPPLAASPATPPGLRDQNGFLHPHSTDRVLYDTSRFTTPTLLFPLPALAGYDERFSGHFQVSFEVTCGGLAAFNVAVASVPGPRLRNVGPLLSIEAEPFRTEVGELEGLGPGLWILRNIDTHNARGRMVSTYAFLRRIDGTPVAAAPGWDTWRLEDGRFFSRAQDEVLYDDCSWDPFRSFVPFAALDLEPGPQTLILRDQVGIERLGEARERQITITLPGGTPQQEKER